MKRLVIALIFLVLVSGCDFGGNPGTLQSVTGGIDFSFYGLPDKLMNDMPFTINLDIFNYMTKKMDKNIKVCLGDVHPDEYSPISGEECTTVSMEAASVIENQNGQLETLPEEKRISFPINGGEYAFRNLDFGPATFFVTVGYPVDTTLSRNIYLLYPSFSSDEDEKKSKETGSYQDFVIKEKTPITIDYFEKEVRPLSAGRARLKLVLHLTQAPEGVVYASVNQREGDLDNLYMDIDVKGYDLNFNCGTDVGKDGKIKLVRGTKRLECYSDVNLKETDPHQVNLNINLKYYYKVKHSVTIPFETAGVGFSG
ncbi:MAG: hypothetical protein ABH849_05085 [Nanoarchaeota archaeon]